jgi:nucleotide-binding universal stress UspA family protein
LSGVILALPDRPCSAPRVLEAAACLAELSGATRVNVLAIRTPPSATILPSEEVLTQRDAQRIRSEERHRVDRLKSVYDAWAAASLSAAAAEWSDAEGLADQLASEWGRRADFIVLARPAGYPAEQERRALQAALFDTGRPVLVVPPEQPFKPFGRCIAIAWRDDGRTIQAVLSVLRWAGRAEHIHILAGTRDSAAAPKVPEILEEHGIRASLHVLPIAAEHAFGEALLNAAHRLGADLLAMGAFVHNPLRNMILGGVTRYMLAHADLPVLMRH